MNAIKNIVVLWVTAVALLFGFIPIAMADFEPPDRIVVPQVCGNPQEWVWSIDVVWENPKTATPFAKGFVFGEDTLPKNGIISIARKPNSLATRAHSNGGVTLDLRPRKQEARILVILIKADGPNGSFWHREFNRDAVINTTRAGGCVHA